MNVLAGIALPNSESVGFHERLGFKLVGVYHNIGYKLGRFHDAGWWDLLIGEINKTSVDIKPVHELMNTSIWKNALQMGTSKIK